MWNKDGPMECWRSPDLRHTRKQQKFFERMAANTWLVWVSTEFEFFHWKQRWLWFAGVRQVGEGLCVQLQWWSFIKVAASQRWIQSRHAVKHSWKLQSFYTHFPSKYTFNDFEAAVNWCLNLVTILSHLRHEGFMI